MRFVLESAVAWLERRESNMHGANRR